MREVIERTLMQLSDQGQVLDGWEITTLNMARFRLAAGLATDQARPAPIRKSRIT